MSTKTMTFAACTAVILAVAGATAAQRYQSPVFNSCIRQFYDPAMYNWLSFENSCSQTLAVTYVGQNAPYFSSSATVRPGQKTSTGLSRDEVTERGGVFLYVCPDGYLPVDGKDEYVKRPNVLFRCRQE